MMTVLPRSRGHEPRRSRPVCQLKQIHAVLLPDGHIASTEPALTAEAVWRVLGSVPQAGESMSFVRVEQAESSWTALVPTTTLDHAQGGVAVFLNPQSGPPVEPLGGWLLFC